MLPMECIQGRKNGIFIWIAKKFLNRKFPYGNKINFNSYRKGEIIGEHQ